MSDRTVGGPKWPFPAPPDREETSTTRGLATLGWALLVVLGAGLLIAATAGAPVPPLVPVQVGLDGLGALVVMVAYAAGLGVRVGGRPWVAGLFALALGVAALSITAPELRAGAAVLTAVLGSVLGVVATRPATTFLRALRELAVALLIAALGGLGAIGFRPTLELVRFQYLVLGLSFLLLVALVYRLGAGLHGLGRRGLIVVPLALVVVTATLAYGELLRAYGTPEVTATMDDVVAWSQDRLGGFPRPLQAILGIPALVWGCHIRARRRQGWWVCAFGVAATAPLAYLVAEPASTIEDLMVTEVMSVLVGMLLGYAVIRLDLFLSGPRGRRARRAEAASAARPEPARTRALL